MSVPALQEYRRLSLPSETPSCCTLHDFEMFAINAGERGPKNVPGSGTESSQLALLSPDLLRPESHPTFDPFGINCRRRLSRHNLIENMR